MQWQTNEEVVVDCPCLGSPPLQTQPFLLGAGPGRPKDQAQHPTCLGGCTDRTSQGPFQKLSTRSRFKSWMRPLLGCTGSPPPLSSDLHFPSSTHNLYSLVPGINSLLHHRAALVPHKPWLTHSYSNSLIGLQSSCELLQNGEQVRSTLSGGQGLTSGYWRICSLGVSICLILRVRIMNLIHTYFWGRAALICQYDSLQMPWSTSICHCSNVSQ